MPAMKTGLFKGQQPGKETPEKSLNAMERKTSKDRKQGDCTRWTSRGDCTQFKHDVNNQGNMEKRKKEIGIKGKGPKGTSPSGKSNKPVCTHFLKGQLPKGILMRSVALTRRCSGPWMQLNVLAPQQRQAPAIQVLPLQVLSAEPIVDVPQTMAEPMEVSSQVVAVPVPQIL